MYNICVIAYPTNSSLEEQINEFLLNFDFESENDIYCGFIQEIELNNPSKELEEYIKNGFKEVITNG